MSFKAIFALTAINDWFIYKIDMKSAFIQEALTDDIYIYQPEGFKDPKYSKKVLKLNKALYSLKQVAKI
jgi:Reverse transcriptase (RNA-dependent DNA polymerase)